MTYVKNHTPEAVKIIPVSESTLRRDMRTGKVSSEKDRRGRNLFDTAELARVYGDLKINGNPPLSSEPVNDSQMTDNDTPTKIVALLESQNTELKAQLEKAHTENAQLLELATRLQKQNELLMIPRLSPNDVSSHSYAGNKPPPFSLPRAIAPRSAS